MKIIVFIFFILCVVLTDPSAVIVFAAYGAIIFTLILISQVPLGYTLKRSLVVIPFVLAITIFVPFFKKGQVIGGYSLGALRLNLTYDGLMVLWNVLVKSYLSVLCMILLTSTTRYAHLLRGLGKLKCPALIVMVLSFMYRYIFLFEDELDKMMQAKAARTIGGSRWFHTKALANILGNLFVRSYERGESVYLAMCARGFDGEIRTMNELKMVRRDFLFSIIMISVLAGIKLLDIWRL